MSVEMLRERGSSLAERLLEGDRNKPEPEAIEQAVCLLGQMCIAGRAHDQHHDRMWLGNGISYWTSVLCLETGLTFSTPLLEEYQG
jgi:hypothetical protein